jgi:hypothetical protein
MPPFPCSVSDFKAFFARDFNYAPTEDQTNVDEYIVDADITRAIAEAQVNFNESLFDTVNVGLIFAYLVAFHLVANLQNSAKGISSQSKFPISSTSVGGVSISFQIPDRYAKDPIIQQYTQNGYGKKYVEFALPYLVAVASTGFRRTSSA